MRNTRIFPREEKAEILFHKIMDDSWACKKLFDTFCDYLFYNDDASTSLSPSEFAEALFGCYQNRDLSAFLMAISNNTLFDLLRNSYLIPYRFNADGRQNPLILSDENGLLLPEYSSMIRERDFQHFHEVYKNLPDKKNIYLAQAYRYSHTYGDNDETIKQKILEKNTGILLIRDLPDTVKLKETEAEAYCAVWDLMLELEKNLPMAYVFYGQDTLIEHNEHFDELGIFLPDSLFLKNLERNVKKAEEIIYAKR